MRMALMLSHYQAPFLGRGWCAAPGVAEERRGRRPLWVLGGYTVMRMALMLSRLLF